MASSRETILKKLRAAQSSLPVHPPVEHHLPMIPLLDVSRQTLVPKFIEQAERLGSTVHCVTSEADALITILSLLGESSSVLSWAFEHIPLTGLESALQAHHIAVADTLDPSVHVGITGVDAALATTGSILMSTGVGKQRTTSLLPLVHIAVVRPEQIIADFETWVAHQRSGVFHEAASTIIISGPSRTADIAMQLMMGMHGPAKLHIILLAE